LPRARDDHLVAIEHGAGPRSRQVHTREHLRKRRDVVEGGDHVADAILADDRHDDRNEPPRERTTLDQVRGLRLSRRNGELDVRAVHQRRQRCPQRPRRRQERPAAHDIDQRDGVPVALARVDPARVLVESLQVPAIEVLGRRERLECPHRGGQLAIQRHLQRPGGLRKAALRGRPLFTREHHGDDARKHDGRDERHRDEKDEVRPQLHRAPS
jgi:hypothetical protein